MVLFLREDYPITHALLEKVNVSSRSATGGRTIPNLVQLFDMILKKNKETFEFLVSLVPLFCCINIGFSGVADDTASVTDVLPKFCGKGGAESVFEY